MGLAWLRSLAENITFRCSLRASDSLSEVAHAQTPQVIIRMDLSVLVWPHLLSAHDIYFAAHFGLDRGVF